MEQRRGDDQGARRITGGRCQAAIRQDQGRDATVRDPGDAAPRLDGAQPSEQEMEARSGAVLEPGIVADAARRILEGARSSASIVERSRRTLPRAAALIVGG